MPAHQTSYHPPAWANSLKNIPATIIKLAQTPTPIQEWNRLPGKPDGFQVMIKRDDMTGSTLSGNKVRKLEFILSDVISKSCRHVITCGALQSNHCRAVAAACAELGLQSHLFLRSDIKEQSDITYDGNLFLNKLSGAHMYFIEKKSPYLTHIKPRMEKLAQDIRDDTGEKSYLVPVGGSDHVGNWGYIQCFEEIRNQEVEFDDMVFVCGSGGLAAGLTIANYLSGSPYKCHGITVNHEVEFVYDYISSSLEILGLSGVDAHELIHVHNSYIGAGYSISQPHELEFISRTATETGILLDTVYTGKAAYGLTDLMQNHPEVFKGRRVLFIHSGGVFSLLTKQMSEQLIPFSDKSKVTMCPPL